MIIAVDFDGTCVKHRYPMVGEGVDGAALKKCYDVVIDGTLKPHENDFVKRCVKAHNSTVDELRSLGKLSPQDDTRYSIEYKDSIVPLQESTDEDATTATYKKTYKFIGTW